MSAHAKITNRFKIGDRVAIASRLPIGHCRTPWYLRGHTGIVAGVHGAYHDPERLAYHKPGLPLQVLYRVRFLQSELWRAYHGTANDHLEADIYEYWLEPAP